MPGDSATPVAVVTGAGSGIGRAASRMLAGEGYDLVLVDRNLDAVRETGAECAHIGDRKPVALQADLGSADDVRHMITRTVTEFGRVDVLHNNAGLMHYRDSIEDVSESEWRALLDVLLTAAFIASREVFPIMREQGGGLIVHTASRAAWTTLPWGLPYTSAKNGLLAFSRSLAALGAPWKIRSNAICPGPVRTALQQSAPDSLVHRLDAEGWVTPEDVAEVIRHFIAHPDVTAAEVLVELRDEQPTYLVPEPLSFVRIKL
jgi:3-oxoacyl-[acyl-carrier protein] reductase